MKTLKVKHLPSKTELLQRVRNLVQHTLEVRCSIAPTEITSELIVLERDFHQTEDNLAAAIDDYMAGKYKRYNLRKPVTDINGLSGVWGGVKKLA